VLGLYKLIEDVLDLKPQACFFQDTGVLAGVPSAAKLEALIAWVTAKLSCRQSVVNC
jgi:hypothetical protein